MLNDLLTIGQVLTVSVLLALGVTTAVKQYDLYNKKITKWAAAVRAGMLIDSVPVQHRKAVLRALAKGTDRNVS